VKTSSHRLTVLGCICQGIITSLKVSDRSARQPLGQYRFLDKPAFGCIGFSMKSCAKCYLDRGYPLRPGALRIQFILSGPRRRLVRTRLTSYTDNERTRATTARSTRWSCPLAAVISLQAQAFAVVLHVIDIAQVLDTNRAFTVYRSE